VRYLAATRRSAFGAGYWYTTMAMNRRPLLLLDVDGVLLPFPDRRPGFDGVAVEGAPHGFSADHGNWLRELAAVYEPCWCTMWGERANLDICPRLGMPRLPVIDLWDEVHGLDRWKLPGVERFVGGRPLAWVDDSFDAATRAWAAARRAPTLLLGVGHRTGLTRRHVRRLATFARALAAG
jgi:hypothetical protein